MARKTLTDRLLRTLKTDAADTVVPGLRGAHRRRWPEDLRPGRALPGTDEPDPARDRQLPGDLAGTGARHRARLDRPRPARHRSRGRRSRSSGRPTASARPTPSASSPSPSSKSMLPAAALQRAIGRLVRGKLIARWRDRPIDTIGKRDVIAMIEDVREKSGAAMARRSLTYARRLFGWAAARDLVAVNPCTSVRPDDFLPPAVERDRVLTDAELALVLKATATDGVGVSHRALHPLCAADGVPPR